MTFSSRVIQRSSPGWPFSTWRGARLVARLEMGVAMPAAAAAGDDDLVAGRLQVAEQVAAVAVADQGPRRDLDDQVLAAAAEAVRALAVLAAVRLPVPLVREVREVGNAFHGADHDVAAVAAVAAVGAAARRVLLAAEAQAAVAAGPSAHVNRHAIDEHGGFAAWRRRALRRRDRRSVGRGQFCAVPRTAGAR